MKRWLLCWWWGPWALAGWILGASFRLVGWGDLLSAQLPTGVIARVTVCRGPFAEWMERGRWKGGFTLARDILLWIDFSTRLIEHEADHVRKWDRWGWIAPIVYLALLARFGYKAHPWEIAARRVSGQG